MHLLRPGCSTKDQAPMIKNYHELSHGSTESFNYNSLIKFTYDFPDIVIISDGRRPLLDIDHITIGLIKIYTTNISTRVF